MARAMWATSPDRRERNRRGDVRLPGVEAYKGHRGRHAQKKRTDTVRSQATVLYYVEDFAGATRTRASGPIATRAAAALRAAGYPARAKGTRHIVVSTAVAEMLGDGFNF